MRIAERSAIIAADHLDGCRSSVVRDVAHVSADIAV
jgi:hypothetical protein